MIRLFILFVFFVSAASGGEQNQKLIVVLLDGFKWDYFKPEHDGLQRIIQSGVRAEKLIPAFPTVSYTNYYSIMTGLYPESHGMIHNFMYDAVHNQSFLIGKNPESLLSYWWEEAEPLWISARRQGKRTHMFYWPNWRVKIRGLLPDFCQPYDYKLRPSRQNFTDAIDKVMELIDTDASDLMAIYFEHIDTAGHRHGPGSAEVEEDLTFVSGELGRLHEFLLSTSGAEDVNLILVSDHGMSTIPTSNQTVIQLDDFIDVNADLHRYFNNGKEVIMHLWPKEGREDSVYEAMKGKRESFDVYNRDTMPEEYHFRNNARIPPIVIVAKQPWAFFLPGQQVERPRYHHGYAPDDPDMAGIFVAFGPSFRTNFTGPPIKNTELYQLMCHIVGIEALPNNGTWDTVAAMVLDSDHSGSRTQHLLLGPFILYSITYILLFIS